MRVCAALALLDNLGLLRPAQALQNVAMQSAEQQQHQGGYEHVPPVSVAQEMHHNGGEQPSPLACTPSLFSHMHRDEIIVACYASRPQTECASHGNDDTQAMTRSHRANASGLG